MLLSHVFPFLSSPSPSEDGISREEEDVEALESLAEGSQEDVPFLIELGERENPLGLVQGDKQGVSRKDLIVSCVAILGLRSGAACRPQDSLSLTHIGLYCRFARLPPGLRENKGGKAGDNCQRRGRALMGSI